MIDTLVLIAKHPVPGRVKTRLTPAVTPEQAARLAAACIDDTVDALLQVEARRRILFYDHGLQPASAGGFELVMQPPGGLDERLAFILDSLTDPVLVVGMDTPQLEPSHLVGLDDDSADAWFGPATDGGFWALGMREPRGDVVRGVPMSHPDTGAVQLERLVAAGLQVHALPALTDVDTIEDAAAVAATAPGTRFARELGRALGGP